MAILTLQDTQLAYGELPLLDRAALAMESGKRLGLIGRNGTGKSSLLGAIADAAVVRRILEHWRRWAPDLFRTRALRQSKLRT